MYQPIFSVKTGWIVGKIEDHVAKPLTEEEVKQVCEKLSQPLEADVGLQSELLPCPFCGGKGIIVEIEETGQYYPRCMGFNGFCILTRKPDPENDGFRYEKDAIKVWNKRASQ